MKEILFLTLYIERKNACVQNFGDFFPSFSYLIQIRTSRKNILLKNSILYIFFSTIFLKILLYKMLLIILKTNVGVSKL